MEENIITLKDETLTISKKELLEITFGVIYGFLDRAEETSYAMVDDASDKELDHLYYDTPEGKQLMQNIEKIASMLHLSEDEIESVTNSMNNVYKEVLKIYKGVMYKLLMDEKSTNA